MSTRADARSGGPRGTPRRGCQVPGWKPGTRSAAWRVPGPVPSSAGSFPSPWSWRRWQSPAVAGSRRASWNARPFQLRGAEAALVVGVRERRWSWKPSSSCPVWWEHAGQVFGKAAQVYLAVRSRAPCGLSSRVSGWGLRASVLVTRPPTRGPAPAQPAPRYAL